MSLVQTILTALRPGMEDVSGLILNASAVDANRTLVQSLQEPFAALANRIVPLLAIVPPLDGSKFTRDPEEVPLSSLLQYAL